MYRAPSKKRQIIQRVAAYSAMTSAVVIFVTVAVFLTLGYRFNRDNNTLQQGGLVQFVSRPSGATITLGSATLSAQTPDKVTANPGDYLVTMAREGYHTWSKNVTVRSGEVLWLNYAQLVPTEIKTTDVAKFASLKQAVASLDGRYFALLPDASEPTVNILDTRSNTFEQDKVNVPVGEAVLATNSKFSIVRWSPDGDKLLLKHTKGKTTEYIVLDIDNPADSYNLTTHFKFALADAEFDPRSSNRLFIRTTDGDVRLVDIRENTASAVQLSNIVRMSFLEDDALMYVEKVNALTQRIGYLSFGKTTPRTIATYSGTKPVFVAAARYFDDVYVAAAQGTQLTVRRANSLPASDANEALPLTVVHDVQMVGAPIYLSMRSGGRFVVVQHQKALTTYDLELQKHTATTFKSPLTRELGWLDRYHLYNVNNKQLSVMEFDGANQHDIAEASGAYDVAQSNDGKYIYSFTAKADGTVVLQRSQMILN